MSVNLPFVTIGIPAFNEEGNIRRLLKSLLSQKQDNFRLLKVLVISDHSDDNTDSEVAGLHHPLVTLISGRRRLGENARLNEILDHLPGKTDYLLILEADTLPKDRYFIHHLVRSVPSSRKFSLVVSQTYPAPPVNWFNRIINFGFSLRINIFKFAMSAPNLYLYTGARLFSRNFLKHFRWQEDLHEDSYCYRRAIMSGLPLVKSDSAAIIYKSVDNLCDFLAQSSKFHKARQKETSYSTIYSMRLDISKAISIIWSSFLSQPLYFVTYVALVLLSLIYTAFSPAYTPMWKIYKSTKKIK